MLYQKPTNARELEKVIADLELESKFQKEEIEDTAALIMDNLKPKNLLKNAWQHISQGVLHKLPVKIFPGPKKLLPQHMNGKKPILLSNG
jgi:hypothetical protein